MTLVFESPNSTTTQRLTERERALFCRIEFDLEGSILSASRDIGAKSSTSNYTIHSLRDRGLLKPRCYIDPFALGLLNIALFFSLTEQSAAARASLIARVQNHPSVSYFGSLLGDYQYVAVVLARSLEHFSRVLSEIGGECGDAFADKTVSPRLSITRFSRAYLHHKGGPRSEIATSSDRERASIDELDIELLRVLGNHPYESARLVARSVGAPAATVDRRIKRLVSQGVIKRFFWDLNVTTLGIQSFRILLRAKGLASAVRRPLYEACRKQPRAIYLIECIGSWDFEVGVETEDPRHIPSIIQELHSAVGQKIADVRVLMELEDFLCRHYPGKDVCQSIVKDRT